MVKLDAELNKQRLQNQKRKDYEDFLQDKKGTAGIQKEEDRLYIEHKVLEDQSRVQNEKLRQEVALRS